MFLSKNINVVTSIQAQKNIPGRFNIFIDGKYSFSAGEDIIIEKGIKEGDSLSNELIREILDVEQVNKAKNKAFTLLSRKEYTKKELHERLKGRFSNDIVDIVINQLQSLGYINDRTYAEKWIEDRDRRKPMGEFRLKQELRKKGISKAIIEEKLQNRDYDTEKELAWNAVSSRLSRLDSLDRDKAVRRLTGFLQRRGFSISIIREVLRKAGFFG